MLCVTVCLAGSEQALHVKNVLEEPQEHGLSEGRWYAVDADEALLEGHSMHTLAGVFGCSLQDLHVLQRAFESNGLVSLSEGTDTHTGHAPGTYHNPPITVSV